MSSLLKSDFTEFVVCAGVQGHGIVFVQITGSVRRTLLNPIKDDLVSRWIWDVADTEIRCNCECSIGRHRAHEHVVLFFSQAECTADYELQRQMHKQAVVSEFAPSIASSNVDPKFVFNHSYIHQRTYELFKDMCS